MNKPELILLFGAPASGKTTWANTYQRENQKTVIVGRDKLREMLFGYSESTVSGHYAAEDFKQREQTVTTYQHLLIREALALGNTVIIDDTNLDIDRIKKFMRKYDRYAVRIKIIHATREECIQRNANRARQLDTPTMEKLYTRYVVLLNKGLPESTAAPTITPYVADPFKPKAYVVDLDGTLAGHEHQATFNCTDEEILADRPIEPVCRLVRLLNQQGFRMQFLSGREDKYYKATYAWLSEQFSSMERNTLHMRKTGDFRKDSIIKQELFWKYIASHYNVQAAIDDRKQVKQMWHDLGVFVFDVNQTDAWF